ncbi:UDP-glucuronosyltransferase 2B5 [Acromyrmex echinatior]|uniref:UDP-glucuronosyltransferase 2B5 n=1 Tax=Acromyrmex echinatior TaxID=103372 RepID=F4X358_ACREC|nr:UDP-glucuronosyltransferase 2B5 [Acromyrmex echinatior]
MIFIIYNLDFYYNKFLCAAHKNVRAIWTHGGLLSAHEAIWKGVPMIVMPLCVDQKLNAQRLIAKGVGIYLDVKTLSTQTILHAVEEILYNERYQISITF